MLRVKEDVRTSLECFKEGDAHPWLLWLGGLALLMCGIAVYVRSRLRHRLKAHDKIF